MHTFVSRVPALLAGALLALTTATAVAQPAETPEPTQVEGSAGSGMPAHGFAPPSDETPPPPQDNPTDPKAGIDEHTGVGTGANANPHGEGEPAAGAHHGGHGDPSKHFNFFDFGWRGKDEYGGKFGDGQMVDPHTGEVVGEEEPMSAPFIFMVINFLILFGLLAWKGGPIARKAAEERHDLIKDALDEASKLRAQAQDKLSELESKLSSADAEIKAMVDGIRKDAETDKARILDNAAKLAAQMKRDAESRIAAEIQAARAALTREVTDAAAAATEKLLREKLQPTDQSKLVNTFIADLGSAQGGSDARR